MARSAAQRASLLARELEPQGPLPYARHATDEIVVLDSGAMMLCLRLDGASFETADVRDLNDWHAKLNGAWRNLATDQLAVWHHLIRQRDDRYPDGAFRSDFARDLDAAYRAGIAGQAMYANALYVTLVLPPGRAAAQRAQAAASRLTERWFKRSGREDQLDGEADRLKLLADAGRDMAQYLCRYGPTPLALVRQGDLLFSEPMALLRLVLTGRDEPFPLVRGHLGAALYDTRVIFGGERLEIRDVAETRFAGMFGVKEYPAATRPGLWDGLLSARFPFVMSQSFSFLSKASARAVMERKQNQMTSARDRATSQIAGLDDALDDLMSNRFVMGDHQASLLVYGDTPLALNEHMSKARALLADSGLVVAREDLALEAAFWTQFPANFRYRVRPAAINSRNFAALAPFHTHPAGKAVGNHWGEAVALLKTSAGSPFHFNFHVGDLGHTFICGPSARGRRSSRTSCWPSWRSCGRNRSSSTRTAARRSFVRACGGDLSDAAAMARRHGLRAASRRSTLRPAMRAFLGQLGPPVGRHAGGTVG